MSLDISLIEKTVVLNDVEVFDANITHNLNRMATEAGIYEACWRPETIPAEKAIDIIPILEKGLCDLKSRPEYFKKFNPENGWGSYDVFVKWVSEYLDACYRHPGATIKAHR